ncbi:MAG TPA: hypothetical protein VFH94_26685 [Streptomyces sp.]|nr:hypothetical protein [Streptomyces sp.]
MFEIRIICEPADAERITTALDAVFNTGPVRRYPARGADSDRLYISADHRPDLTADPWPTPERAYALAPSILSEIAWTAERARALRLDIELGREFWLRKAASPWKAKRTDSTAPPASWLPQPPHG